MTNLANAARPSLLSAPTFGVRQRTTNGRSGGLRVGLVLLATIASYPIPTRAPSSADEPLRRARLHESEASNEPAGYTPILTSGFGGQPTDRWRLGTPAGTIQKVVPTVGAPGANPGSVQVTYPAGWNPAAAAKSPRYRQVIGGGIRNVYLSFWFRLSPTWKAGPNGVDNVLALRTKRGAAELRLTFMKVSGAGLTPSLRLQGLHAHYQGGAAPWLAPNTAPGATVQRGTWHHWELLFRGNSSGRANGKLTWWLDGLPAGDYSGLEFWGSGDPAILDVAWDLTAPTGGTPVQQRISLDEMYLSAPAGPGDRIVVMNDVESGVTGPSPPATTILIDAYTGSASNPCLNDVAIADRSVLANLRHAGSSCPPDEILVFSTDDAATIDGGASGIWSDADEERRVEASREPRPVDVVLWITREKDLRDRYLAPIARGEVDLASALFNQHRAGVRFRVKATREVWDASLESVAARNAMGCQSVLGVVACTCLPTLVTSGYFEAGKVNAYYVPTVFDNPPPKSPRLVGGLNCRYDHDGKFLDPNIVFLSIETRSPTLLAHELGHAFGLEHTADGSGEWYPGKNVPTDNTMRDDAWLAWTSLLLGQAFRVNVDSRSVLRLNGLQTGPERSCECELSAACTKAQFVTESESGKLCPPITQVWP